MNSVTDIQNHKKIVVFGATGTIGKAVVAALSPKYEVLQVGNRQELWITEDSCGELKGDAVLPDISGGLRLVPLELKLPFAQPEAPVAYRIPSRGQ